MLLRDHLNKQSDPLIEQQPETAEPYIVINKNLSKKKENLLNYRKKAKRKALKILRVKLKRKAENDLFDNLSDAETIPYAEPYKNTFTKKDEIYRKKAKKKALKISTNKRKNHPQTQKLSRILNPIDLLKEIMCIEKKPKKCS